MIYGFHSSIWPHTVYFTTATWSNSMILYCEDNLYQWLHGSTRDNIDYPNVEIICRSAGQWITKKPHPLIRPPKAGVLWTGRGRLNDSRASVVHASLARHLTPPRSVSRVESRRNKIGEEISVVWQNTTALNVHWRRPTMQWPHSNSGIFEWLYTRFAVVVNNTESRGCLRNCFPDLTTTFRCFPRVFTSRWGYVNVARNTNLSRRQTAACRQKWNGTPRKFMQRQMHYNVRKSQRAGHLVFFTRVTPVRRR